MPCLFCWNESISRKVASDAPMPDSLFVFRPLRGLVSFHFLPRLAPWAAFFRRFAA